MTDQNSPPKPSWWRTLVALVIALVAVAAALDSVTSLWERFPTNIVVVGGFILIAAAAGVLFKTWDSAGRARRIALIITVCSGLVIVIFELVVQPALNASTPPRSVTVAPPNNALPTQWVGCLRDGRPIACEVDHDAEVVELTSCTIPALVVHMGGVAGVDQLSDTVRVETMVDGSCVVRFDDPVSAEVHNALLREESARFRQCFDREYQSVTCDRVHVAELTQRVAMTESLDCHSAASRYLGIEATMREKDLAWPEINGPTDERLCALSVRNPTTTCLIDSLRRLGHNGIPFSRNC